MGDGVNSFCFNNSGRAAPFNDVLLLCQVHLVILLPFFFYVQLNWKWRQIPLEVAFGSKG